MAVRAGAPAQAQPWSTATREPVVRWQHATASGAPSPPVPTRKERSNAVEHIQSRQLDELRGRFSRLISREPRYATPLDPPTWLPAAAQPEPPLHLPWSPALERQLHAVAQEAGLSGDGAAALVRAAQARRVPSNPGILLAQVVRLLSLEPLLGPRPAILAMLALYPGLLAASADTLAANFEALSAAVPAPQLRQLLLRAPSMLTCSPFSLWSNLHALGMLLDMPAGRVGALLRKAPRLLTTSPALLRQRCEALQAYFELSEHEVRGLVRRQPLLIASRSATLAANAELLLERLGLPPQLVVRMIQKQPALLLLAGPALEAKLSSYCAMLQLELPELALLLIKQPSLLNFTPASIAAKLEALEALMGLARPDMLRVARTCPALLTLAPASVARKWAALQRWAAPLPEWEHALRAATPATRALYLCFSARRLARLRYVAQLPPAAQPQPRGRPGLHRLLMMSQRDALAAFPAMEQWLAAQEAGLEGGQQGPGSGLLEQQCEQQQQQQQPAPRRGRKPGQQPPGQQ